MHVLHKDIYNYLSYALACLSSAILRRNYAFICKSTPSRAQEKRASITGLYIGSIANIDEHCIIMT
jgi:hypothetical protein